MQRGLIYSKKKKSRRGVLSGILLTLLLAGGGLIRPAQAQVGEASVIFLMIEPDSRSASMGNAGVALADNANAIFWNPAGLAYQQGTEAGITHSNWLSELDANLFYEYLVAKHRVEGIGTFGAHVTFFNMGEHERRDELGYEQGSFRSYDLSVGLSYGGKLSDHFALGGGARLIYSDLADGEVGGRQTSPGTSVGVDLAGLYRSSAFDLGGVDATFSSGFNLANMGPGISYVESEGNGDNTSPLPTNLRLGYAITFDFDKYNSLTLANDFSKMLIDRDSSGTKPFYQAIFSSWEPVSVQLNPNAEEPTQIGIAEQLMIGLGAEYWYKELFALRSGYFYEHPYNGAREFLTFGAGFRYNMIGIDFSYIYALQENHPLADTMRFSLLLDFMK